MAHLDPSICAFVGKRSEYTRSVTQTYGNNTVGATRIKFVTLSLKEAANTPVNFEDSGHWLSRARIRILLYKSGRENLG